MPNSVESSNTLKIVIWRHGQTDWNVENRFQGHSDIPLNKVGEFQVNHAAQILAALKPARIISSDLIRTKQTAQALADLVNVPVELNSKLRETNGGKWEGKTGTENRATDGELFTRWIDGHDDPAGHTGERRSEVAARAISVIDELIENRTFGTIVLVTHGGTARCLLGSVLNLPMSEWSVIGGLSNACWSILETSKHQINNLNNSKSLSENRKSSAAKFRWFLAEHNAGSLPEPVIGDDSAN
jgi:probable phosphoglycerate mutase